MIQPKVQERRAATRFDKVFRVAVQAEGFAEIGVVARNISAGGMWIEMPFPLPLGSEVMVRFEMPDCPGSILARAQVKNHYAFHFSGNVGTRAARGMGLRFLEFTDGGGDRLRFTLHRFRRLH